ncbi:MAG TPA: TonB-dependent receptor [Gammaproteobacteria bacterium]|nr:TonB-dependent receptor [Gammaproteobacteria bacterium]
MSVTRPPIVTLIAAWYAFAAAVPTLAQAAEPQPAPTDLPTIYVIGTMPLPGQELDPNKVAAPLQTATAEDLDRSLAIDLTEYMTRRMNGVYVNDIQNNPLQPDISYRGYTASPLLGTAQGLSVYLDGMRLNQPFGDVVSWDLIPRVALASITLLPGSNPLFGLNTLGGALALRTKDGFSDPGGSVQVGYGSHGRAGVELQAGDHGDGGFHWYAAANRLSDDGWRTGSPTDATQLFGKVGWRHERNDLTLTAAYADTDLTGNGLQEQRLLARDYASVYTKPDNTANRSGLVSLGLRRELSPRLSLSGNAYYREIRTATLNGDINEGALGENVYQPSAAERDALAAAGYTGYPLTGETAANTPFPYWRCIANVLLNTEPNEKCNGLLNRTRTVQSDGGASVQITRDIERGERSHRLTAGAAYRASRSQFVQSSQFGYLTSDRGITAVDGPGAFADGTQDSENAFDARVDLAGRVRTSSAFVSDALGLSRALAITLAGRYDRTTVDNADALAPGGGPGSLDGHHVFGRFNPAIGLTFNPTDRFGFYAGYDEGSRAPSTIELGCADPANPCKLPNAMAGDPPLDQVVTKTFEAGVRGRLRSGLAWSAGLFRADNHADILFVADDQAGFGYFRNFGATRRQGVELGIDARVGRFGVGGGATYLDATYRSGEVLGAAGNSTNDAGAPGFEGNVEIHPGDRIPLTPRELLHAYGQWSPTAKLSFDADVIYVGGSYARGNENNRHEPDGVYYLGPGATAGYAVLNLGAHLRPAPRVLVFAQITNLLDRRYFTASQLGATAFTATGAFVAQPFAGPVVDGERPLTYSTFYAPGAPRAVWVGARFGLGRAAR